MDWCWKAELGNWSRERLFVNDLRVRLNSACRVYRGSRRAMWICVESSLITSLKQFVRFCLGLFKIALNLNTSVPVVELEFGVGDLKMISSISEEFSLLKPFLVGIV